MLLEFVSAKSENLFSTISKIDENNGGENDV
jgi:hypothetical protein